MRLILIAPVLEPTPLSTHLTLTLSNLHLKSLLIILEPHFVIHPFYSNLFLTFTLNIFILAIWTMSWLFVYLVINLFHDIIQYVIF